MKRYEDCIRPDGLCGACSFSNKGNDCHHNKINNLLYQRSLIGLTQSALSEKSGVNIRQIQRYEGETSDLGNMTLRNALSLAKALDCEVTDLYEQKP